MKTCSVEGCEKKYYGKGLCCMHWMRVRRYGTIKLQRKTLRERFNSRHIPVPESGCWLWEGAVDRYGYGKIRDNCHRVQAHRVSWILHNGPIPEGLCVLHKCDVPGCVNPDHLFLGTNKDNTQDALKKGRLCLEGLKLGCMSRKKKAQE